VSENTFWNARLPGLREPARRVSRRAVAYWTARAALTGVVATGAAVAVILLTGAAAPWWCVVAVTVLLGTGYTVIMPRWRYAVHRWEVTPDALFTRSGWFSVTWRIAPISRIQTVDSHRSIGERLFGLANVTATTASAAGPVSIHGLDQATAGSLLDELAAVTAAVPGDAT
jgi:membrane protein YdbS with pleckstrin-like domain